MNKMNRQVEKMRVSIESEPIERYDMRYKKEDRKNHVYSLEYEQNKRIQKQQQQQEDSGRRRKPNKRKFQHKYPTIKVVKKNKTKKTKS